MDYAVIMAGGTGKRLWPLSRQNRPKQVLQLFDGETLLRRCFDRLTPVFDKEKIIVLTNAAYVDIVRENLPELSPECVIAEPAVRDTASAIGLAAAILNRRDPDATMAVVTADQIIDPIETFVQVMNDSVRFVDDNPEALITFGIKPTFPSTQLGYLKLGEGKMYEGCENEIHPVEDFREKPDEDKAREYVDSGNYCWNSGMFVFKAATMLGHLEKFLPDSTEPLNKIGDAWGTDEQDEVLNEWFVKLPKISIDYAVMERAPKVFALSLGCRWLDMGSFTALSDIIGADTDNNVVVATCSKLLDSRDNILVTEDDGHLIALIGVENMVVAHSHNATLICPIDQTQRLKELLEMVNEHHGEHFL